MNQNYAIGDKLFEDALHHIKSLGFPIAKCKICFSAKVFAFSFILNAESEGFIRFEFKPKVKNIVDGLVLFLKGEPTVAAYIILPQLDGIIKAHLINTGLLKETNTFPEWTELASKPKDKCKNIRAAIEEAIKNPHSRIGKTTQHIKYDKKLLTSIQKLRNATLHGSLTTVEEHDMVDIVHLLIALYHDLELFDRTNP